MLILIAVQISLDIDSQNLNYFQGEPISFDDAVFVASRPLALQPFLQVSIDN